jgi:hypothetical protein
VIPSRFGCFLTVVVISTPATLLGYVDADIIELSVQELREKHENNPHKERYFLLC